MLLKTIADAETKLPIEKRLALIEKLHHIAGTEIDGEHYTQQAKIVFPAFGELLATEIGDQEITPRNYLEKIEKTITDVLDPHSALWHQNTFDCPPVDDYIVDQIKNTHIVNAHKKALLIQFFTVDFIVLTAGIMFSVFISAVQKESAERIKPTPPPPSSYEPDENPTPLRRDPYID